MEAKLPYCIGQTVRVYDGWFNHNDAVAGWYKEGIIEKIEPEAVRGYCIWFRITKVVCSSKSHDKSFMIGKLSCYNDRNKLVTILDHNPQLVFTKSKPWWE